MKDKEKITIENARGQQKVLLHEQMLGRIYNQNHREDINEML